MDARARSNWWRRAVGWVDVVLPAAALPVVAAGWGFVLLAGRVGSGDTHAVDDWVLRLFRRVEDPGVAIGPRWLTEVARDVTALGGVAVLSLVTLAVAGHYWLIRRRRAEGILVVAASFGALVVNAALKGWFQRARPTVVPRLVEVGTSSFPSGHAMLSAAVYLTLGILLARSAEGWWARVYYLGIAAGLVGVVGVSRVFLGVHYPSDVLAGWTAGLAWALACRAVAGWVGEREEIAGRG